MELPALRPGEQLTGYPAVSIWHEFKYHPKEVITGTQDWLYEHLGALFCGGDLVAQPCRRHQRLQVDRLVPRAPGRRRAKLLKWSDEQCGGQAHVDWKPFMHPQLGMVEIGGWDKMNFCATRRRTCASARRRASRPG